MPCSEARLNANRQNALKSTGPQTVEGKATSRRNSLKHGLAGAGIVLPTENHYEVLNRVEEFEAELAVAGSAVSRVVAQKLAMLTVRSERLIRHELATTAERVRNAEADFDEARRAEADHLLDYAGQSPATNYRRLLAMPEGCDLLIKTLAKLREGATVGATLAWSEIHSIQFAHCRGCRPGDVADAEAEGLRQAILFGRFDFLDPIATDGMNNKGQIHWALNRMVELIDAEIARVEAHQATLDLMNLNQSRAEAADRALVDDRPAAILTRRYEAATERYIKRAFIDLRQIRRDHERGLADETSTAAAMAANLAELPEMAELDPPVGSFGGDDPGDWEPIDASTFTIGKPPVAASRIDQDPRERTESPA